MQTRILAGLLLLCAAYCPVAQADTAEPPMLARAVWEGKKSLARPQYMEPHGVAYKGIVIHHTEISQQNAGWNKKPTAQKMRDIRDIHLKNTQKYRAKLKGQPWGDFAYHYFIDISGQIAQGRDPQYQGDSGTNYDMAGLLLIVLQGSFIEDRPTPQQLRSLDQLTAWLAAKHGVTADRITAHNDHASTDCPGPNLKDYLPELKRKTAAALKAK